MRPFRLLPSSSGQDAALSRLKHRFDSGWERQYWLSHPFKQLSDSWHFGVAAALVAWSVGRVLPNQVSGELN